MAIHDHPKPSHYWNPDTVLEAVNGRTPDRGLRRHRSLAPLRIDPVECLKKLEGRVISLHFKDINKAVPKAYDVPWGTGVCDVKGMLTEMYRQKFRGLFYAEYEHNWETSLPEIAQCVKYFDQTAAELAAQG